MYKPALIIANCIGVGVKSFVADVESGKNACAALLQGFADSMMSLSSLGVALAKEEKQSEQDMYYSLSDRVSKLEKGKNNAR